MHSNEQLIAKFYSALVKGDITTMKTCYDPNVEFRDPVFGVLQASEVLAMWEMLIKNSKGNLKIDLSNVLANEYLGKAQWTATYPFSATNATVVNRIQAQFHFKNGLIIKHIDDFDLYKWSKQAFGIKGALLGWTGFFQNKIQQGAKNSLQNYIQKRSS